MRVVLDTNVLISALLWPKRTPSEVVRLARHGAFKSVTSSYILEEFRRVLRKKFEFEVSAVEAAVEILLDHSEIIESTQGSLAFSRDPADNPILDCAVNGKAATIITGDKDLLRLDPFRSIRILTPKNFLDSFHQR